MHRCQNDSKFYVILSGLSAQSNLLLPRILGLGAQNNSMPLNLFDVEEELFGIPPDIPILPEVNFVEEPNPGLVAQLMLRLVTVAPPSCSSSVSLNRC